MVAADWDKFFQELITKQMGGEFIQLESYIKNIIKDRKNSVIEIDKLKKDRTELEMKKSELAELLIQSREAIVERDEEIKKLKTVSDEYERELEAASLEYDEKCEKNNSLFSTVSKLKEENENLVNQIKSTSQVKQENEYNFELSESSREAELILQLQVEQDKVTGVQGKLSHLESEMSSLREKYKNQAEEIESRTEKIQSLEEKLEKLQNINQKLLVRKREYKRAETSLRKDFELYKKKTKQNFQRLQKDILLVRNPGLSGHSDLAERTNTINTGEYLTIDRQKTEEYEESLKKIKSFKVPRLKRKEGSPTDTKTGEITKCGDTGRAGRVDYKKTLFVANLNYEITSSQLTDFFSPFGLEKVELPRSGSDSTKNKGLAWVTFKSGEEAGAAIKKTNKQYFHDRQLSVRWSNGKR